MAVHINVIYWNLIFMNRYQSTSMESPLSINQYIAWMDVCPGTNDTVGSTDTISDSPTVTPSDMSCL